MDIDLPDATTCNSSTSKENRLVAIPVTACASGQGLPYAPEDWPYPGDKWRWKVGSRKSSSGHWLDRYLYAPPSCPKCDGRKPAFPSRISLVEYLRKEFPQMDIDAFFSLFIWKIPCANNSIKAGIEYNPHLSETSQILVGSEHCGSELAIRSGGCKAGNKFCSLKDRSKPDALPSKDCDVCCSEAGFCRECCCILCSRTIDLAFGGYGFVRCEAVLDENHVCGHVAHVECALRSYMAGKVGGSIGLDVEYYCRRCDNRIDLMSHVSKLIKVCESLDSRDDIEKILNLGFCILRGSQQTRAIILQSHIGQVIAKLKRGVHLDEIWKMDDNKGATVSEGMSHIGNVIFGGMEKTRNESKINCINNIDPPQKIEETKGSALRPVHITSEYDALSAKLEDEIDQVLQELKRSQQSEYTIAEEKLYAQKDFLLSLYQQLEYDRSELANPLVLPNGDSCDALLSNVLDRVEQIKVEEERLTKMMKVALGFGRAPKIILAEDFGLAMDD